MARLTVGDRQAAIDHDALAHDVRGIVRQQEHHGLRDLVGLGVASDRRALADALHSSATIRTPDLGLGRSYAREGQSTNQLLHSRLLEGRGYAPGNTAFTRMPLLMYAAATLYAIISARV